MHLYVREHSPTPLNQLNILHIFLYGLTTEIPAKIIHSYNLSYNSDTCSQIEFILCHVVGNMVLSVLPCQFAVSTWCKCRFLKDQLVPVGCNLLILRINLHLWAIEWYIIGQQWRYTIYPYNHNPKQLEFFPRFMLFCKEDS